MEMCHFYFLIVLFLLKLLLGSEQQYFLQATRKFVAFFYLFLKR